MVIGGKVYTNDLMLLSGRVVDGWWRREGHRLWPEDLETVLEEGPRQLVLGTGASGLLVVTDAALELMATRDIELIAEPTTIAWRTFNRLEKGRNVVGAFHLTC